MSSIAPTSQHHHHPKLHDSNYFLGMPSTTSFPIHESTHLLLQSLISPCDVQLCSSLTAQRRITVKFGLKLLHFNLLTNGKHPRSPHESTHRNCSLQLLVDQCCNAPDQGVEWDNVSGQVANELLQNKLKLGETVGSVSRLHGDMWGMGLPTVNASWVAFYKQNVCMLSNPIVCLLPRSSARICLFSKHWHYNDILHNSPLVPSHLSKKFFFVSRVILYE